MLAEATERVKAAARSRISNRPRPSRPRAGLKRTDPEAKMDAFRLTGRLAVPTVLINERVFLGFGAHRDEIETLMRE